MLVIFILNLIKFQKIDLPQHRTHLFDSDYCLKGRKMIINGEKEIVINKKTCTEYKWKWYEKSKMCKLSGNNNIDAKLKPSAYKLNKEDCLNEGYCWDSNRNFCEAKETQYCINNEKECIDKNGTWNKFFKSCKMN